MNELTLMMKTLMYSIKQNLLSLLTSYKIMPVNTIEMGLSLQHMNFGSTFNLKKIYEIFKYPGTSTNAP